MPNQDYSEDEIDLRDCINVIVRKKKLILAVFFISVIIAILISLVMPKVYRATASIMITPSKMQAILSPQQYPFDSLNITKTTSTGAYITSKPAIPLSGHIILLKSNVVLERMINRLKLTDLTPGQLSKRLEVKEAKDTGVLQLEAEDNDSGRAKEIANAWAQEYIGYSQELILGDVKGTGEFITDQFEVVKQNLVRAEEAIKDFKNKYKIDLMRAELDIKKKKLNEYKNEVIDIEMSLNTQRDSLEEFKKEIEKQEKFIIVSKAITNDALWQKSEKDLSGLDKKKLRSEEINPIYENLETEIVNTEISLNTLKQKREYLTNDIKQFQKDIDELEKTINQKEFESTQLNRQAEIYKRTYDGLSVKIEEARIAKAIQLGEVKIVSPAFKPEKPVWPNKLLNVAISAVVGLLIGIFLAFFAECWKKSEKTAS